MNPILSAKLGAAVALIAVIFGAGWTACKWHYEALQTAQLQAVATAYQNQVLAREASEAKLKRVEDAYDAIKDSPDLAYVAAGTAHRLLIAAAGGCPVPASPAVASGIQTPATLPGSAGPTEQALAAYIDACAADAAQMKAMIELAP